MRLVRLAGLLTLLAMPFLAVAAAIVRVADAALALWPAPDKLRMTPAAPTFALSIGGTALPRDVQNALRHEAGQSKRSAARHT